MTATVYYLPNHIALVSSRLWYYIHGDAFYDSVMHGSSTQLVSRAIKDTVTTSLGSADTAKTADNVMRKMHEL